MYTVDTEDTACWWAMVGSFFACSHMRTMDSSHTHTHTRCDCDDSTTTAARGRTLRLERRRVLLLRVSRGVLGRGIAKSIARRIVAKGIATRVVAKRIPAGIAKGVGPVVTERVGPGLFPRRGRVVTGRGVGRVLAVRGGA